MQLLNFCLISILASRVDLFLLKLAFELVVFFLDLLKLLFGHLQFDLVLVAGVVSIDQFLVKFLHELRLNA